MYEQSKFKHSPKIYKFNGFNDIYCVPGSSEDNVSVLNNEMGSYFMSSKGVGRDPLSSTQFDVVVECRTKLALRAMSK
jgi:hypothetical protein